MDFEFKKQIRDRVSHIYGLSNVLQHNADVLRKDTHDFNLDNIKESLEDANETIQNLMKTIKELKYDIRRP